MNFKNLIADSYLLLEQDEETQSQDAAQAPDDSAKAVEDMGEKLSEQLKLQQQVLGKILKAAFTIIDKSSNELDALPANSKLKEFVNEMKNASENSDMDIEHTLNSAYDIVSKYSEIYNINI